MTEERENLLNRRLCEAAEQQPGLVELKRLLLEFGGTHLVAPPLWDVALPLVIGAGFVMAGPVVRRTMKRSGCHRNVAEIWVSKDREIVGIGTGYGLSTDGLWRQHSWGVRRHGILETTVPRVKYFGILLQHADADIFAMANYARKPSTLTHKWRRQEKIDPVFTANNLNCSQSPPRAIIVP